MIDKANIKIENKLTKKINYTLSLDTGWWCKLEYDTRGNVLYHEDSSGYWCKWEFDTRGKRIYYETSRGFIKDDR